MNKLLWQFHSWMGLIAGIGLLVIGLTGSLLVFHEELEEVTEPGLFLAREPSGSRLPFDVLLADVEKGLPDYEILSWSFGSGPDGADWVYVVQHGHGERLLVTLHPYTGAILGGPLDGRHTVTGRIMELHYTFFAGSVGTIVVGVFAVLLCLLGVSGVWIYREFWSNFVRLRWRASRQIFFSDLHKAVGIASVVFHLILGFTGAYWNIPSGIQQFRFGGGKPPPLTGRHWSRTISLDAVLARSPQEVPGFRPTFISFPAAPGASLRIFGHVGNSFRSEFGSVIVVDPQTGATQSTRDIRKLGLWEQFLDTFRPLHYGTFGGVLVKILWCVGGLTPGVLAVTGFVMWLGRRKRREVGRA
ncbi:MAG TPA: PepSY-associated TM helix domain-containing protein [Candidatus Limnocylindria bacterium]|nr:PepSY-associated TM helix domain-containing protein [Candidatus Limnocylindria bacterium]